MTARVVYDTRLVSSESERWTLLFGPEREVDMSVTCKATEVVQCLVFDSLILANVPQHSLEDESEYLYSCPQYIYVFGGITEH